MGGFPHLLFMFQTPQKNATEENLGGVCHIPSYWQSQLTEALFLAGLHQGDGCGGDDVVGGAATGKVADGLGESLQEGAVGIGTGAVGIADPPDGYVGSLALQHDS